MKLIEKNDTQKCKKYAIGTRKMIKTTGGISKRRHTIVDDLNGLIR